MFTNKAPLPQAKLKPPAQEPTPTKTPQERGVLVGHDSQNKPIHWNPFALPNGHITGIGASGMGKTQTLKALVHSLLETYSDLRIVMTDLHGDLHIPGETCYELSRTSPDGINLLAIDLDPAGGGPKIQMQAIANLLEKQYKLGTSQKSTLKDVIRHCYAQAGIFDKHHETWQNQPPTFAQVEAELEQRIQEAESAKERNTLNALHDKLSDVFTYGIFSKPQPDIFSPRLVRIDLSALAKVDGLQLVAVNSIAKQLLDHHRLLGENSEKRYLMVDESRALAGSQQADDILRDGRKFGLSLGLFSQMIEDLSPAAISNASSLLVLGVTPSDLSKVSRKFRFAEPKIAALKPLEVLCRFGRESHHVAVIPYFKRVETQAE
ncbi:DUF87 domain-containing protein [Laspinema sp. A4]|uniref:ATP-binding protein n=1 Tax=Laspinema sp. D2d TaxID=2953686 RepID=UPI0021BBAEBF|nr:DUF87 domain-containing protein [Laspinema sp. D2d]MCT7986471.1 DUF87 domain-containing protein [Laspinema sp. D2d]